MLETFTIQTFTPLVNETFRVAPDAATALPLVLTQVTALEGGGPADPQPDRRTPFSLIFRGPPQVVLPQRIYHMEHDALGAVALFLVPIGSDAAGMLYEAIFT